MIKIKKKNSPRARNRVENLNNFWEKPEVVIRTKPRVQFVQDQWEGGGTGRILCRPTANFLEIRKSPGMQMPEKFDKTI